MSMKTAPLLIEIGTEEIPAGVAPAMVEALKSAVERLLAEAGVEGLSLNSGVTPRRLLLRCKACPVVQKDREETLWGPPEKVAFANGKPTKAAEGFARKSGLSVEDFTLADKGDGKDRYMKAVQTVKGRDISEIIAEAMPAILRKLPSPKQMKWNDGNARDDAFIRPVRWIVARLGDAVIPFSFAGVEAGKTSHGHRIHGGTGELDVGDPFGWLRGQKVEADRDARMQRIRDGMAKIAANNKLEIVEDDGLVAEVADLTEWPVPVLCEFDADFLRLPEEVIRITLKNHQRCFITRDTSGKTSNRFFAIANIESKAPAKVAEGNARVVNARLSDAAFYFDRDPQQSLESRVEKLAGVTFQEGLGTVAEQVVRLRSFVAEHAHLLQVDAETASRAAHLCKSDLTTGVVGEFPELQGYIGGIYASQNGEPDGVCRAIAEHYRPAGAEDALPDSLEARAIAIAERADKLVGYFHLGRIPTASADPFGLRRAAIGLIRLLANDLKPVAMTLSAVLRAAAGQWREQGVSVSSECETAVRDFIVERLTGMAGQFSLNRAAIESALGAETERPLSATLGVAGLLAGFADSETGQAVAAANKRIANILKKSDEKVTGVDAKLFAEPAEKDLFVALQQAEEAFPDDAEGQLQVLAGLRGPVDRFFDDVMVMAEDAKLRINRLALLTRLRGLFLKLADISRL
jgi:glycyl-tRNA synthetase beta chain